MELVIICRLSFLFFHLILKATYAKNILLYLCSKCLTLYMRYWECVQTWVPLKQKTEMSDLLYVDSVYGDIISRMMI